MDRASTIDRGVDYLEHFGVLGMRWGYRKLPNGNYSKGFSFGRGAPKSPPSEDATAAQEHRSTAKSSGVQALSNAELQRVVSRMNLEQQYAKLTAKPGRIAKGQKFTKTVLGVGATANDIYTYSQSPTGKKLTQVLAKNAKRVKKVV
jgi:hypothetical protein